VLLQPSIPFSSKNSGAAAHFKDRKLFVAAGTIAPVTANDTPAITSNDIIGVNYSCTPAAALFRRKNGGEAGPARSLTDKLLAFTPENPPTC
jgi:hypothetical protein